MKSINREISWLSFNERVLQEAEDQINPLVERMRFLGIFSNNLDEFFRVRVATIRRLIKIQNKTGVDFVEQPQRVMNQIHETVIRLQKRFDKVYKGLIKELGKEGVFIIDEMQLNKEQKEFVHAYYLNKVEPILVPIMLKKLKKFPYLDDDVNYLFVDFIDKKSQSQQFSLIEIPSDQLSRFLVLPEHKGKKYIIYLDDVIRANLTRIFKIFECDDFVSHVFKITRDAELDLDEYVVDGLYDKLKRGLEKRKKGEPLRFIYDKKMPETSVQYLMKKMNLFREENIIPGERYHNFKDFMKFPNVGDKSLVYNNISPLNHPYLDSHRSMIEAIAAQDVLLHYPFQNFDYIIDLLREAAISPTVKSIKVTIYRLASDSKVVNALISAVKNGKDVVVVIELQARFDEEANMQWAKTLTDEGVRLVLGSSGLKIHSKLILIEHKSSHGLNKIAHIGTGNFHEGTANVYSDISLLTARTEITDEVEKVFRFIEKPYVATQFDHLLVSPRYTRNSLMKLIDEQIERSGKDSTGYIMVKSNSLMDVDMIDKLYEAAGKGVKIDLIIRGICTIVPEEPKAKGNIRAISILDRYLEHSRIYIFGKDKAVKMYISSADIMTRNLDRRIEVATPIYDERMQKEILDYVNIQLSDNVKARIFNESMQNKYVTTSSKKTRSQVDFYKYLKNKK
ncbi:MAG: polyphosphate kinase [Bacteroidia bacterium]|jgi:polyphosphate kinase